MKTFILASNTFKFILDYKFTLIKYICKKYSNSKIILLTPDKSFFDYQKDIYKEYKNLVNKFDIEHITTLKRGNKFSAITKNIIEFLKIFLRKKRENDMFYFISHTATINISLLLSSLITFNIKNFFFRYFITGFGPSKIRNSLRSRLVGRIYINLMQKASSLKNHRVITLNKQDRDIIQDYFSSRDIFLLRDSGISPEQYYKFKSSKKKENNILKIAYIGRFLLEKGINDLHLISSYLETADIDHAISAYGSEDEFNSSSVEMNFLKSIQSEKVNFYPPKPYEDILKASDIILFPSCREGHPKLVLLSMLFQCIPIVAPNPGLDVDVLDLFNGMITSSTSPSSFAAAIIQLKKEPELLKKLKEGCSIYINNISKTNQEEECLEIITKF